MTCVPYTVAAHRLEQGARLQHEFARRARDNIVLGQRLRDSRGGNQRRGQQGAAGDRHVVCRQRQCHGKQRGHVEGRIAPFAAFGKPPLSRADGRPFLVHGQRRIEERQADHILRPAKQCIDTGLVAPPRNVEAPTELDGGLLLGEQPALQVDPQRRVVVSVVKCRRLAVDQRAHDHHVAAIVLEHGIEAKDQVGPGVGRRVGDDDLGRPRENQVVDVERGADCITRHGVLGVQVALKLRLQCRPIYGQWVRCGRGRR